MGIGVRMVLTTAGHANHPGSFKNTRLEPQPSPVISGSLGIGSISKSRIQVVPMCSQS